MSRTRRSSARLGQILLSPLLDLGIVFAAYALALWLKFDASVPSESWKQLSWAGPLIALAYISAYQILGVYRTAWQYGSVRDALLLGLAVALVTAGILAVNALLPKRPIPLTVNVMSAAFIFLFHAFARMAPRLWQIVVPSSGVEEAKQRVLIVGSGDTGQLLAWELQHSRNTAYQAVCFVDDDPSLAGKRVHGIPVEGDRYAIPALINRHRIDALAIALPPDPAPRLQEILALCEPFHVPVRLVPGFADVMEGRAARGELQEITVEELLARESASLDDSLCREALEGRTVLITGAAGSIGSELSRQVLAFNPTALHLIDINETALEELRVELNSKAPPECRIKPWLSSITDGQRLQDLFEAIRPQVVFHLAAYKYVAVMEEHPEQAFETNVAGTLNVFEAAQAVGAERVVFVSSHTAVNPTGVYGASKRIGELLAQSMGATKTRFCAVRLVNVIDAKGTVMALFARQIQGGGPIRVTDPEVARYFLSVNEVAMLLIQAASLSEGDEIFLLDVGEEVRIRKLAERMIRSQGMEPGKDIEIVYTGLRPGEKLRENLTGDFETVEETSHERVVKAVSSRSFLGAELMAGVRELEVDSRRRYPGNLPARLHALARIDEQPSDAVSSQPDSPRTGEPSP